MCRQLPGETIDQFVQRLEKLSKDCDCRDVTAENYRLELMRDAFIAGMLSVPIRQRLHENREMTFWQAYNQARDQEMAHRNAETFQEPGTCSATAFDEASSKDNHEEAELLHATAFSKKLCYFCGQHNHPRKECPAKDATCNYCNKIGHFYKVC